MIRLSTFLLATLLLSVAVKAQSPSYYSAACLAKGTGCGPWVANRSNGCKPNRLAKNQPGSCKQAGCTWCRTKNPTEFFPCKTDTIKGICSGSGPSPPQPPPGQCAYRTNTRSKSIVISMGNVQPKDGWTRISRAGYTGIIYRRNLGGGRDNPGQKGVYCFPIIPRESGSYQLTTLSYTPSFTEHNDVWLKASSPGFSFWMEGRFYRTTTDWVKGYQNDDGRISDNMFHKDWDPHRFMLKNVRAGRKIDVCISGRSYKYELYRIVIKKCVGRECRGFKMSNAKNLPVSRCS